MPTSFNPALERRDPSILRSIGQDRNCQMVVSLPLASDTTGSLPILWRLYLSKDWTDYRAPLCGGGDVGRHRVRNQARDWKQTTFLWQPAPGANGNVGASGGVSMVELPCQCAGRGGGRMTRPTRQLAEFPFLGAPGRIPGTRELIPHENDRLVYQISGDTLWILALVHTARLWPPLQS